MSTPEQPLTRRQLRELRNTGSTPIITIDDDDAPPTADAPEVQEAPEPPAPVAPLPRPAQPVQLPTAPIPDASVDLGAAPLTRRQARQQERIRTASIPVITADPVPAPVPHAPAGAPAAEPAATTTATTVIEHPAWLREVGLIDEVDDDEDVTPEAADERARVNPLFGAHLLTPKKSTPDLATSFEQLLGRDVNTTGSTTSPSALIVTHTATSPLIAPINGTGELLVTGTFVLPEGLGSTGRIAGTADGKEVDAVLVDGELPAHSSPTPIAASAAVSTIVAPEDVIQPPTPEKSGKLMLTLAITAGVLALALVGVLVFALATGVIS